MIEPYLEPWETDLRVAYSYALECFAVTVRSYHSGEKVAASLAATRLPLSRWARKEARLEHCRLELGRCDPALYALRPGDVDDALASLAGHPRQAQLEAAFVQLCARVGGFGVGGGSW